MINVTSQSGLKYTEGLVAEYCERDFDNDGDMDLIVGELGIEIRPTKTL